MLPELETIEERLARNLQVLDELTGQLREDEMRRPPRPGQYSGHEIIAHLAGADKGMTGLMRRMAAGENPRLKADYNNDYYNARQQEKRAGMSISELRDELDSAHRELVELMETLRPENLDKRGEHPRVGDSSVRDVLQVLVRHEEEHLGELSAWADRMMAARG